MVQEQENVLRQKAKEQLALFLSECEIEDFRGKRILEIGFKNGLFLDECYKAGLAPVGLEINKTYCDTVSAKFPHVEVLLYDGGTFPVADTSSDFVVSFQVLEHVRSIEHIFSECVRVLKPGGVMYHICPNYFSFYEGHYAIIWFPFLNKSLGRTYLKLLRRDPAQFENLNPIKPRAVARALKTQREKIKVISLGRAEFVDRFNHQQIDKVNQKLLRAALKVMLTLPPLIRNGLLRLIAGINLYYPITIIARHL
jgi:SAM-dependent methyltransferase